MQFFRRKSLGVAVLAGLALHHSAGGAPVYWNGTATGWDTTTGWSSDISGSGTNALPTANDVATFSSTGVSAAQTVSLNDNRTVAGLNVTQTATVTLQGGGTDRVLSLGVSGITTGSSATTVTIGSTTSGQQVSVSLLAAQSWSFNGPSLGGNGLIVRGGVSLANAGDQTLTLGGSSGSSTQSTISGAISNGGADRVLSITLNPSGTGNRWTLSGNNTYTGATTISKGALTVGSVNGLGATTAGTTVASGAGLFLRTSVGSIAAEPLSLSGTGESNSLGALRNVDGVNTWTGPITVNNSSTVVIGADAGTLTLSNTADINATGSGTLSFVGAGAITVNGDITGSVPVTKSSGPSSALTLGGEAKAYSGATTVSSGFLYVTTNLTNTSGVTIAAGATLRGLSSTINQSATVTVNGTIGAGIPATPISTLSVGPLSLTAGSTLAQDINTSSPTADKINVNGNLTLSTANDSVLALTDLGSNVALPQNTAFTLIDYTGTWNGGLFTYSSVPIADDTGTFTLGANTFSLNYNGGPSGNDVILQVVPEPGTLSLVALAGVGLLARRRRV